MLVKRTNHSYDLDKCLVEWELIQSRLGDNLWSKPLGKSRQTCIQRSNESGGNPFTDGTGSIYGNNPVKDRILMIQSDYIILNDIYEDTVFADVIRDMHGERSRIMHMQPHTTYSVHKDKSPRYHLALITNPNAYFIFPTLNEIVHIPADGYVYEVDTTILHSFVNCGKERDHLVMAKKITS
jgi:hypothetical protein|tara:strand:+ start:540 stop:1085 length:546 start_codon:yes stop_codon:yes gene_type:complete